MSLVYTALDLRYIDGDTWQLLSPFKAYSTVAHAHINVPAGFVTDFNSIPRLLTNILPREEYGEAAVLHDKLYREGKLNGVVIDRELADRIHREFVQWKGAPAWKVAAMFRGLRLGGWVAWRKYRKAEEAQVA